MFCVHGIFSTNGMKSKEIEAYWHFCMHFDNVYEDDIFIKTFAKTFATDAKRNIGGGDVL